MKALRKAGLEPVPATPAYQPSWENIGGLVLSGGSDLDPALYGQTPHPNTVDVDVERDQFELMALGWAISAGIPVLCICRGMQLLNVFAGGTLHQDIAHHVVRTPEDPGKPVHSVSIAADSQLRKIVGVETMAVNSRHHQAVDSLGRGLSVSATAPDGVVEAIEMEGPNLVVGVQWHPEDQVDSDPLNCRLFEGFLHAVSKR